MVEWVRFLGHSSSIQSKYLLSQRLQTALRNFSMKTTPPVLARKIMKNSSPVSSGMLQVTDSMATTSAAMNVLTSLVGSKSSSSCLARKPNTAHMRALTNVRIMLSVFFHLRICF